MNPKTHAITRRTLLRGFGATLALPYLEIMGGGTAAAAAGAQEPRRLACFYVPGAINRHAWFPKDTGRNYTLADSHKPLEKFRDEFSVLTNLSHITGRISGHVHPYNWLTGHNINIVPGTVTNTVSMDQVAAKHLGPTWVPSLALSFADGVGTTTLSRNAMGVDVPATASHRTVFERLFPPADRAQLKEAEARLALSRSVLDTAAGGVRDAQRHLGAEDRRRLDQYLESVREVEKRLGDSRAILDRGRPKFDEAAVKVDPQAKNSMREHIELMTDLIALAFQTDMTRVVTHSLGGEGGPNYDEYKEWAQKAGAPVRGAHDVHHKGSGDPGAPDSKVLAARDAMLVGCLARLVEKLKGVRAADGTLLDHTVLLFGGAQISSHSGKSFPTLVAGGRKLGFRHGQHLKWDADKKPMSDLYLTILQQLGCPVTAFKESTGPISELLA
ncbi:Uncharacterized protein OS=Lentisphaera araneosa HTCC2155 GN=LNTAR_18995 PE=4 SV=1: HXXSHH [Gemmataceae bacterium]|nr:Uncharacterized protein OS=Lentisphaera araneosa HTCC2155 GN=LNTAR_18995 PE=4 SV=1: HXXSHH [Gemmataceae bacterium]VTT99772.1 Uncharacterized protein OS=Lentisphaera araneosa HTCC2155 GN=LNTAR_18995 PE=4 SV=1: HXXSHH [Gemmataceae bacterium]